MGYGEVPTRKVSLQLQMMHGGISARDALCITNQKESVSGNAAMKLRKKYAKWSLTNPKLVQKAQEQVERILASSPRTVETQKVNRRGEVIQVSETIVPPDSVILAAAGMVYDRFEPLVQRSITVTADVHPVDISQYLS